jgi:hypothetical protein
MSRVWQSTFDAVYCFTHHLIYDGRDSVSLHEFFSHGHPFLDTEELTALLRSRIKQVDHFDAN